MKNGLEVAFLNYTAEPQTTNAQLCHDKAVCLCLQAFSATGLVIILQWMPMQDIKYEYQQDLPCDFHKEPGKVA